MSAFYPQAPALLLQLYTCINCGVVFGCAGFFKSFTCCYVACLFRTWLSNRRLGKQADVMYMRWDQDYDLYPLEQLDLFYEYLELGA